MKEFLKSLAVVAGLTAGILPAHTMHHAHIADFQIFAQ
jgi:hypothetical protein